jgi:cortexillin 1/2
MSEIKTYAEQKGTNVDQRVEKDKKWENVQIKAFKSWVNTTLAKKEIAPIDNVQTEFQDGVKLIQFLEIVSDKPVAMKYSLKPQQKIQKIQNINIALDHIQHIGVKLASIGAEDIYDGNLKLILGSLWTLFRALRIQTIKEGGSSSEDALLLWLKKMTEGYEGINITNFKDSFQDGRVFSALVHRFDPSLLDYNKVGNDAEKNLENAFNIAEKGLGIPKLLEPGDVLVNPDERSIILYVSLFFHAFVANEDRIKERQALNQITKKNVELDSQLEELESEVAEQRRQRQALNDRINQLEAIAKAEEALLDEAAQKAKLLQDEINFMRQRALADAEAMALLEEKNRMLQQLLDQENLQKGEIEESRARLLADIEELRRRARENANENEDLEDQRKRLLTNNDKKNSVLADLEARKNALLNDLENLKKQVNAEMERRKAAVKNALQLKKELDDLKKKQGAQDKARLGLDVLRRNLEEHLEDMYRWRELHDSNNPEELSRVFDLDKVADDLKDKSFEQQLEYLDDILQAENINLLKIIRRKDADYRVKDVEVKSGWLLMKGRKDWKKRWFSLRGFTLYYFVDDKAQKAEGFIDLTKGCEVVRQKALKEANAKQWPLKIVVGGDRKLFVRAPSKKDRHSWFLFLSSKIAHLGYLKAIDPTPPDSRLVTLFVSDLVTDLYLDDRVIPEQGAVALSKTLPAHDETKVISLVNTGLNDQSLNHVTSAIAKSNVTALHLSKNNITSAGASALAAAINQNATITSLDLSDNKIDDKGIVDIANALASKHGLTTLNLSGNNISKVGVAALLQAFGPGQHALLEIHLNRNNLGDDGAAQIAELIKANPHLTTINISGNKIGNRGAQAIADAFHSDSDVITIDLSDNEIGTEGALALSKAFDSNKVLIEINLSNNKISSPNEGLAPLFQEGVSFPRLQLSRA